MNKENNLYAEIISDSTEWESDTTKTDTTETDTTSYNPVGFLNNNLNNNLYAALTFSDSTTWDGNGDSTVTDTTETDSTESDTSSYSPVGYNSNMNNRTNKVMRG